MQNVLNMRFLGKRHTLIDHVSEMGYNNIVYSVKWFVESVFEWEFFEKGMVLE